MDRTDRVALRQALARLYPTASDAKMVSHDAGLALDRIDFGGAAREVWFRVLQEAENARLIVDLVAVAHRSYPTDPELQRFAALLGVQQAQTATGLQPPSVAPMPAPELPPSPGEFDLFASYRSIERARVTPLVEELRARGLRVFVDDEQSSPGAEIIPLLEGGLVASRGGIIFLSEASLKSGWVREEYHFFVGQRAKTGFRIIPVLLDNCAIPPFLTETVRLDLRESTTRAEIAAKLARELDQIAAALHVGCPRE